MVVLLLGIEGYLLVEVDSLIGKSAIKNVNGE